MQAGIIHTSGSTRLPKWRTDPPFRFGGIYFCSTYDLIWPHSGRSKPDCAVTAVVTMDSVIPVNSSNSSYIWVAPIVIGRVAGQDVASLKLTAGEGGILESSTILPALIQPIHRAHIADRIGTLSPEQRNRLLTTLGRLFPAVARLHPAQPLDSDAAE